MHKLMEGLLAAHRDAGNAQALEVLNKLAAWIDGQMTRYGDDLEKVKKGEYGGMTEALENLYELTRNPRHREMAHAWEQRGHMLEKFHQHEDVTEHANTLLAKMVGAARIAEVEQDGFHQLASENFWDLVAGSGRKTYATGGTSVHEGMPGVGLRVNLFIASTVDWPEKGLRIEQVTRFPEEAMSTLVVRAKQPVEMGIAIRVPGWCRKGFAISVNGKLANIASEPGSYATIRRTWKSGDRIEVGMPMTFATYPMPDKESQLAFLYGPLVMVGAGARPWLGELVGDLDDPDGWVHQLETWFKPVGGEKLAFTARDGVGRTVSFKPYYQVGGGEFFTGYWDVVKEPVMVDDHNLALGKRTICDQPNPPGVNVECFLRSGKAVDGQYGGHDDWYVKWFPNGMAPRWITVDLGGAHQVSAIEWFPAQEDIKAKVAYRYQVEHSTDNESWQPYAGNPDNTQSMESYRHERAVTARYMKLTILPQPGLEGNAARPKVAEFKVFGPPAAGGRRTGAR